MFTRALKDQGFQEVPQEPCVLATTYTPEATGSGPDTPMLEEELFPVSPDTEISEKERRAYQKIVGSILFTAISSRPDIVFANLQLSKFNQRPVPQYIEATRRIVRYLYKIRFLYL